MGTGWLFRLLSPRKERLFEEVDEAGAIDTCQRMGLQLAIKSIRYHVQ